MSDPSRTDLTSTRTGEAEALLARAVEARVFPAAVAETGDADGALWRTAFGRLTFDDDAPAATATTIFDLSSLTKPIATATLAIDLMQRARLDLAEPLASSFPEWRGVDRDAVTVRDLLEHASGLPARLVDPPPPTRREFEHEITTSPLEYAPRARSIYSDLGFILLGFVIAARGGVSLADGFARVHRELTPDAEPEEFLGFEPSAALASRAAPTTPLDEDPRRGRRLVATVHDNYAAALGGVAGHAGLFGTAPAIGRFARLMLRAYHGDAGARLPLSHDAVLQITRKSTVPGSSRALGWDTMLPTSSSGTRLSPAAFGHVGFTGTSLWIDPLLGRYFVLLTNRAYGAGTLDQIRSVRRAFHDILASNAG